ncbi:MAG: YhbY family RNA-binding protein [Rhodocyclaceae bacterium]
MKILTPAQRSELRARAHRLHPVAVIGQKGLTPSVLEEIVRCLDAHELIKVRVLGGERETRETLLSTICQTADAAAVQHIGNILILFREKPADTPTKPEAAKKVRKPSRRVPASPAAGSKTREPANPRRRVVTKRP